jgi:hypothetical protein
MKVDISTFLPCSPAEVAQHASTSRLFAYVAAPMVSFTPIGDAPLPETWEEGTYWVSLRMFGVIPFGKQAIVVTLPDVPEGFSLRDNGYSGLIKKWDHLVSVEPFGAGTLYRDQVKIGAGVFTLFVWAFAELFFRHRQRRWRRLVANGFDYDAA